MEEKYPEVAVYFDKSISTINNMDLTYEELYKQPIEYWFDNYFEYAGNSNYTIGFRFMAYLHDKQYPFTKRSQINDVSLVEHRIAILKQTYGEDVLDNFYPWLKAHEGNFAVDYEKIIDRSAMHKLNLYPEYNAIEERMVLENIKYNDLHINLEPARKYIGEYKGRDISNLVLVSSQPLVANLYLADGSSAPIIIGNEPIPLADFCSIQLVGEGTLDCLEIRGFH